MSKLEINPLRYPSPLTFHYVAGHQRTLKHLGVSPTIDNGICYWRVIWRPFLKTPVHYRDARGRMRIKRKEDNVRTERYAIVNEQQDKALFELAVIKACQMYRLPNLPPSTTPQVDWEMLAKATGQKIRNTLAKPLLNEGTLERAIAMFEGGASNSLVAKSFGVNRSTASRWRKKARLGDSRANSAYPHL
jgi:hypothetical protein